MRSGSPEPILETEVLLALRALLRECTEARLTRLRVTPKAIARVAYLKDDAYHLGMIRLVLTALVQLGLGLEYSGRCSGRRQVYIVSLDSPLAGLLLKSAAGLYALAQELQRHVISLSSRYRLMEG